MPSTQILEQKKQVVNEMVEKFKAATAGVFVDYRGLTVEEDTELRRKFREAGVEYTVTKNTMIELAIKDTELAGLSDCLAGTTALATSKDDYVAAARILCKFANTHKDFTVKSGFLDNEVISLEKIDSLAKLPSREVLLATVCNAFNAPISAFARAVQAIVDKGGEATAEAAAE